MLKVDLTRAGIAYCDEAGRYADFHALRHSSGTFPKDAGIHPELIQTHMSHSTLTLTRDRYTHQHLADEAVAVDAMPEFIWPTRAQTQATTGTTGDADRLPLRLAAKPRKRSDWGGLGWTSYPWDTERRPGRQTSENACDSSGFAGKSRPG